MTATEAIQALIARYPDKYVTVNCELGSHFHENEARPPLTTEIKVYVAGCGHFYGNSIESAVRAAVEAAEKPNDSSAADAAAGSIEKAGEDYIPTIPEPEPPAAPTITPAPAPPEDVDLSQPPVESEDGTDMDEKIAR